MPIPDALNIPIPVAGHDHGPRLLWAAVATCPACRAPIYEVFDATAPLSRYLQPLTTWVGTPAACNHARGPVSRANPRLHNRVLEGGS